MGANLNRGQTISLVAAPLGTIILAVFAYLFWRRRRNAKSHTGNTTPLQQAPARDLADDEQPMAETLRRGPGSQHSSNSPPSVTTTDILLRAEDDGGPLRSHPITMLGPIPQSPWSQKDGSYQGSGSFRMSGAAHVEGSDGDSTYSDPILAPFGQEYIHGRIRYSPSPMKYVTKLDDSLEVESSEAVVDHNSASSSRESKHQSWASGRRSRRMDPSSSSVPNSPTTTERDWISPMNVESSTPRRWSLTDRQGGTQSHEPHPDDEDEAEVETRQCA